MSPGMRDHIVKGDFQFPPREWNRVSKEAKDLVQRLLVVDPKKRATIDNIVSDHWIKSHRQLPELPLGSADVLASERPNWEEMRVGFLVHNKTNTSIGSSLSKTLCISQSFKSFKFESLWRRPLSKILSKNFCKSFCCHPAPQSPLPPITPSPEHPPTHTSLSPPRRPNASIPDPQLATAEGDRHFESNSSVAGRLC